MIRFVCEACENPILPHKAEGHWTIIREERILEAVLVVIAKLRSKTVDEVRYDLSRLGQVVDPPNVRGFLEAWARETERIIIQDRG